MNPSDTPKTDAAEYRVAWNARASMVVDAEFSRQLERELNAQVEANQILNLGAKHFLDKQHATKPNKQSP